MNYKVILSVTSVFILYTGFVFGGFSWMLGAKIDPLANRMDRMESEQKEIKAEINSIKLEQKEIKAEINSIKLEQKEIKAEINTVKTEIMEIKALILSTKTASSK